MKEEDTEFSIPENFIDKLIDEAILWHGGEAQASKVAYEGLSDTQRNAVLDFLDSL